MKGQEGIQTIIVLVLIIPKISHSQNFVLGDVSTEIHCPKEKPFPCYPHMSCCGFDEYCSSKSSACEPCISFSVTKREEALQKCLKTEWTWESGQCRYACFFHFEKEIIDYALKNVSSPKQTASASDVPRINETPSNESLLVYVVVGLSVITIVLLFCIFFLVLTKTDWFNRICGENKDTSLTSVSTHSSTENSVAQLGQSNGSMDTNCSTDDELKQTKIAPTKAPDHDVPEHEAREEVSPLLNRADDTHDSPGHGGTSATNADIVAAEQARLRGMHLNETNSDKFELVTSVSRHQNSNV